MSRRLAHLGVGRFAADQLPQAVRTALALAYQDTFELLAIAVLPALLVVWFLHPPSWMAAATAESDR
jgi:hypothetical protein